MSWWTRLLGRSRQETRLDTELRDHIERQVADYQRAGLSETEARRRAALSFGGLDQTKEACRDARGTRWADELLQDLRYGWRMMRKDRTFTLVAVLTLALGIGANAAIFSLVDSVLLKTLPVKEPERLVLLDKGSWTNPIWEQIRGRQTQLFDGAAAWMATRFDLAQGGQSEFVDGLWTSGGFFDLFGVQPILGRTFTALDDQRGGGPDGPVAVISHAFWQRRFGGAADVLGRSITLDRVPFTIIGVTPPSFFGPSVGRTYDVAIPLGCEALVLGRASWLDLRSAWWLEIVARLKPRQTIEDATTALRGVQPQIRLATMPERYDAEAQASYLRDGLTLIPAASGTAAMRTRYQHPLLIIMAVVGLVLLIACANIANLLLARASGRQHEFSMRLALGASRFRLVRQLLAESVLLAAAGAALGLVFAQWGSRLLVQQLSTHANTVFLDLTLDWRVVGFTAAVAAGTALLFGLAPAFRAGHAAPTDALKEHGRGIAGAHREALGSPLVVAQVALSLVLVVAAGLFMRTFTSLATLDLGFDRDPILIVQIDGQGLDLARVDSQGLHRAPESRYPLYERVMNAAAAVPGVSHAGLSQVVPISGKGRNTRIEIPGGPQLSDQDRTVWVHAISPDWLATYGTALRAGRGFTVNDRAGAPQVLLVNEAFARKFAKAGNPIGLRVNLGGSRDKPAVLWEVVGVVEDAAYRAPREPVPPTVYLPMAQEPPQAWVYLSLRAKAGSPMLLVKDVAAAIGQVDRRLALAFRPMTALIDGTLVRERILALLSGFFGLLALVLSAIGLYGVTAYGVSRRRTEIGIRLALGADTRGVVRLVLGRVALLVGIGIAIGGAISLWASRYVATLLYGLEPRDPLTLGGAALVLALVGALAGWLPARRASRLDAARVLREG